MKKIKWHRLKPKATSEAKLVCYNLQRYEKLQSCLQ